MHSLGTRGLFYQTLGGGDASETQTQLETFSKLSQAQFKKKIIQIKMALNRTCPTQVILDQTLICTQDKTVNRNRNTTNYTNGDKPVDTNTVLDIT